MRGLDMIGASTLVGMTKCPLRNRIMRNAIIALSLAALAMSTVAPSYAAGAKACKPAKKGYELNKNGACVKSTTSKKKK